MAQFQRWTFHVFFAMTILWAELFPEHALNVVFTSGNRFYFSLLAPLGVRSMAITQASSFATILVESGLLVDEQLAEANSLLAGVKDSKTAAKKLIDKGLVTRWQASQLLAGKKDLHLGKYRLLDRLGKGGMGSVFLAEHTMMKRRVAIKTLPHDAAEQTAAAERLRAEARAIAALDHRNIIHAYDTELSGDNPYLVMEYVAGQDLEKIVASTGRLDFRRAADYIAQAAEGLAHAHSRNLIHCDIKPANLLVDPQGTVKILDLGLASLKHPEQEQPRQADNVLGTVDFLAPEQAMGAQTFDRRADVYSLGCTLYFVLTAQPPFPEGSLTEKLIKHQQEEPRSLLKLRPRTPHDLVRICRKMMAKKPDERFATADEVATALRKWLTSAGDDVPDDSADAPAATSGAMPTVTADAAAATNGAAKAASGKQPVEASRGGNGSLDFLSGLSPAMTSGANRKTAAGTRKPVKKLPAKTAAKEPNDNDEAATPNANRNKFILIGAAAVSVVALIAIVVVLLTGNSPKKDSGTDGKGQVAGTDKDGKKIPNDDKNKDDKKSGSNKETLPENKGTSDGSDKSKTTNANDVKTAPKNSHDKSQADDKKGNESPDKTKPNDDKSKTENGPPKLDLTAPVEPPKSPDKTVVPPKPPDDKKPTPPAPPAEPFKDYPVLADLPPLGSGDSASDAVSLGKIHLAKDGKLELSFVSAGGKGSPKFNVAPSADASKVNSWEVQVDGAADAKPFASLAMSNGELQFQWLAGAKAPQDQFKNGLLKLKVGDKERVTPLRKYKDAQPLVVDVDKPPMSVAAEIDALPDPEHVYLQVLKLESADLTFDTKPGDTLWLKTAPKPKDQPLMAIGGIDGKKATDKAPKVLGLAFSFVAVNKNKVKFDAAPQYQFNNQWSRFVPKQVSALLVQVKAKQQGLTDGLALLTEQAKTAKLAPQVKPKIDEINKTLLPAANAEVKQLDELNKIIGSANTKAKVHYRIYEKIEDREVDLVRTLPPDVRK